MCSRLQVWPSVVTAPRALVTFMMSLWLHAMHERHHLQHASEAKNDPSKALLARFSLRLLSPR